jgi:hypothetical protein
MLKRYSALASLLLLSFCSTTQAQVYITYVDQQKPYFTFNIPDLWRVNVGSDTDAEVEAASAADAMPRIITAMPDDGTVLWFGTWLPRNVTTLEAAHTDLNALNGVLLDNAVSTETKVEKLNGMPVMYIKGTGEKEGKTMDFFVTLFELSAARVGIAIYIGPPATTVIHRDDLKTMIKSIKPAIK